MNARRLALLFGCAMAGAAGADATGTVGGATWHNGRGSAGWLVARTPSLIQSQPSVLTDGDRALALAAYCRAAELTDDPNVRAEALRRCADLELALAEEVALAGEAPPRPPMTTGSNAVLEGPAGRAAVPGTVIVGDTDAPIGLWLLPWRRTPPADWDRLPAFSGPSLEPVDAAGLGLAAELDASRRALRGSPSPHPDRGAHSSQ